MTPFDPFDPFAPDAIERLESVAADSNNPIPIYDSVWNAPRMREPFRPRWKLSARGWTASIVPSDLIFMLVSTVVMYLIANTITTLALMWFEFESEELLALIGLNAILFLFIFPMGYLWLLQRMRRCLIVRVCVARSGETELMRRRLLARRTPKMERPVFALAFDTSTAMGLLHRSKRNQFQLLACEVATPRALIAVADDAGTMVDLVKSMPQEVLDRAEFLLIDRPVINPSSN